MQPKRIKMAYCSSAEGQKFQRMATEFDKIIKDLGPSPLKSKSDTTKEKEE